MIACAFLLFAASLWLGGTLAEFLGKFGRKIHKNAEFLGEFSGEISSNLKLKYALTLIFTALFLVPFYEGFCGADFLFAFFDAPSPLCVLLLAFFVLKNLLKDFAPKNSHKAQIFATLIKPAAFVFKH